MQSTSEARALSIARGHRFGTARRGAVRRVRSGNCSRDGFPGLADVQPRTLGNSNQRCGTDADARCDRGSRTGEGLGIRDARRGAQDSSRRRRKRLRGRRDRNLLCASAKSDSRRRATTCEVGPQSCGAHYRERRCDRGRGARSDQPRHHCLWRPRRERLWPGRRNWCRRVSPLRPSDHEDIPGSYTPGSGTGQVIALQPSGDGRLTKAWDVCTGGSPNLGGVAVTGGVVFFQSPRDVEIGRCQGGTTNICRASDGAGTPQECGHLHALDSATGRELASVHIGAAVSGPSISRGLVYLGTGDFAVTFGTRCLVRSSRSGGEVTS
jgi:hypothetical protein